MLIMRTLPTWIQLLHMYWVKFEYQIGYINFKFCLFVIKNSGRKSVQKTALPFLGN